MNYRRLGKTGLKVSELSYGSWVTFSFQLGQSEATEILKLAYDSGVNFFDNAEAYASGESEVLMGNSIKKLGWSRDSYIVSSKVFWGGEKPTQRGLSHKHILDACHAALKRLKVDYLDLFFCHRPDSETPIEETVRAMHTLILQGKICYWGTSEWSSNQITEAFKIAKELNLTPPSMEQPEYNMFKRDKLEDEYLSLFEKEKMGTTIWSPLASGLLTGKYIDSNPENTRTSLDNYKFIKDNFESKHFLEKHDKVKKLKLFSDQLNIPLVNLALCWCLKNKNVSTVILGASKIEQLKQNLESLDYMNKVDKSVMENIDLILK
jgi:voltage-dependent potassium channel beta subunit|tara:strand:- start:6921 stop:7883 length:963 start_codon:yes stop_codon:yes gene_type:complete